jgi:hypothetical protein
LTRRKFVIRTGDSAEDDEEELKKNKELIILVQAVKYCETEGVDRIRYRKLKQISNDRLAALTRGEEVDFGGNFEVYISKLEKEYEHEIELVKRIRYGKKKTFILPNIQKITKLFNRMKLNNLFDEEAIIKKPIFIEYDDSFWPSVNVGGEQDSDGNYSIRLIDAILQRGVYTARYYYKNGHPVFLKCSERNSSSFDHGDADPFYKKTNYLYHKDQDYENSPDNIKMASVFTSDEWNIQMISSDEENIKLKEENITQLLKLGNCVASRHPSIPFKIILQYEGTPANRGL